jgi:hypothetical protein
VTIYLPDELADRLRREAKRAGESVSAYIAGLVEKRPSRRRLPPDFEKLYGSWKGEFPEIEDPVPEEIEPLE